MLQRKRIGIYIFVFGIVGLVSLPTESPAAATKRIKIACVGDSITYGSGINDRDANSYPALLQRMLGDEYDVGNFGYSGATLLKKGHKPYWEKTPYPRSLEFQPDIVVINLGANDAVDTNWKHASNFSADYKSLIEKYRSLPSRPQIYVCEILPIFPNHGRFGECIANRTEMTPMIRDVAKSAKASLVDLHKPFIDRNTLFPDGLHPNENGTLVMAQHVFTALTGKTAPAIKVSRPQPFVTDSGTSFENVKTGVFRKLDTEVGTWTVTTGETRINGKMAASGQQCLHMTGGAKTLVELELADTLKTRDILTFRAERWTKAGPFSFRVEKQSGGEWSEIYNGDKGVVVGRPFKSNVEIPLLDEKIKRLRFSVVSPANTGAMIDDLQFQKKTSTTSAPATRGSATTGYTSFESAQAGRFDKLTTELGTWTTFTGKAGVDHGHAKNGRQCLHLPGDKSVVELQIAEGIGTDGQLTFWAERWTSRSPFAFRIEKQTRGGWTEIFNGDRHVRTGRSFLSSVKVPLNDSRIRRLRFSVSSPENTGILIDDVRIAPARPQQIVGVEVVPFALPALVGAKACPLIKLKIETIGSLKPISMSKLTASLTGTSDVADIESILLIDGGENENFALHNATAVDRKINSLEAEYSLSCPKSSCQLSEGSNYFWIACKLKPSANVDNRVSASCRQITFSNDKVVDINSPASIQQMGVSVRTGGDDGVHTYRIPGLATTKRGSLIAVYDIRQRSGGDLPGDIDVGMSRSINGGRTWEPMQVIMDMGDDPNFRYDGIGDPTVLVDKVTGTVWCAATWSHGNRSWIGSGPGLEPTETGQFILVKSDDDGVTWSKPINITKQVKKPEWSFLLQGPGKGITMKDGTIILPAQYQDPPDKTNRRANRLPHSAFIYSTNHGKTWATSTGAFDDTTEAQVVELADGQIMINCRYNREARRVVLTTRDLGKTWTEHPTNRKALIEPGACMASLINVGRELRQLEAGGKYAESDDFLLFSNPDSLRGRNHMTIKASLDGGQTWPAEHHLLLDEQNSAGYSCLTVIDAETVGIIYEGSQAHMTFQRVKIADILKPPANQKTKNPAQVVAKATLDTTSDRSKMGFSLARVFGDHMVLQARQPIRVWGYAKPEADVKVVFGNLTTRAKAASDGNWIAELPAQKYNTNPQTLTATSGNQTDTINDVLVGEVWLCAGQSNMEWPLSKSNVGKEAIKNSRDSQLRLMNFVGAARGDSSVYNQSQMEQLDPGEFSNGHWEVAAPASSAPFSAVGYYFGQRLREELDCPVGLINVSIGGTPIEAWVSSEKLSMHPHLSNMVTGDWLNNPALDEWCRTRAKLNLKRGLSGELKITGDEFGPNHSFKPGFMYVAGIKPFIPMSIRGALWYQGESNGDTPTRTQQYDIAFPLLVSSWRSAFQNKEMPIAFVQLPAMGRPNWPVFREYQRRSLSRLTNVGMAITIDTGESRNVHPGEKQPVGQRLAQWVLVKTYGKPGPCMGPLYQSMKIGGGSLVVSFDTDGGNLTTTNGAPNNFEVAGVDGIFHSATARISDSNVILTSPQVPQPQNARFAWSDFPKPKPNLFNSVGLPASPFTTEEDFVSQQPFSVDGDVDHVDTQ